MFCSKCGQEMKEGADFCPYCGTYVGENAGTMLNGVRIDSTTYTDEEPKRQKKTDRPPQRRRPNHTNMNGTGAGASDMTHRVLAGISYFGWIGFLVAFVVGHRQEPFMRFHLNQALVLVIVSIIANVIGRFTIVGTLIEVVLDLIVLAGVVIGAVSAFTGKTKTIPVFGKICILK